MLEEENLHQEEIRDRDKFQKEKIKQYKDRVKKARKTYIEVGDVVVLK